jgi:hypothetical protein
LSFRLAIPLCRSSEADQLLADRLLACIRESLLELLGRYFSDRSTVGGDLLGKAELFELSFLSSGFAHFSGRDRLCVDT